MKIKICGLTRESEAAYLNDAGADYAGFVFHPPSKRNVNIEKACAVMEQLKPEIQRVAVCVSPEAALIGKLQRAGFDLLQIHGELTAEVLKTAEIPIWYAVNITETEVLAEKIRFLSEMPVRQGKKIQGIVVDGADYGGGKTFGWEQKTDGQGDAQENKKHQFGAERIKDLPMFDNREFVLAGGLTADNVQLGIRLFSPDIVDVSSGVESVSGKDREMIIKFIKEVQDYE